MTEETQPLLLETQLRELTSFEKNQTSRRVFGASLADDSPTPSKGLVDDLLKLPTVRKTATNLWGEDNESSDEELELATELPSDLLPGKNTKDSLLLDNSNEDKHSSENEASKHGDEGSDDDESTGDIPTLSGVLASLPPPVNKTKKASRTYLEPDDTSSVTNEMTDKKDTAEPSDIEFDEEDSEKTSDDEKPSESNTDNEPPESNDENQDPSGAEPATNAEPIDEPEEIDVEAVLNSTDLLFSQVPDKASVTVKDIIKSLSAEYNTKKLSKHIKAAVRERLVQLVNESQEDDYEPEDGNDADDDEDYQEPRRKLRKPSKKSTKLALRVHAEQRRKRRLEELRVRNEEMSFFKTKKDQERASEIAKRFEIDTSQNMALRLKLLEQLDTKRIACVQYSIELPQPKPATPVKVPSPAKVDHESSDSDDDMELEVEGDKKLFNPHSALDILDRSIKKKNPVFPNPRKALMESLRQKQISFGNLWLAKELGYKNPQEHVEDCLKEEMKKKSLIAKLEAAKVQQRNQLRERLLKGEELVEANDETELEDAPADEDEDEELAMAKVLEEERESVKSEEEAVGAESTQEFSDTVAQLLPEQTAEDTTDDDFDVESTTGEESPSCVPFDTQLPTDLLPTSVTRESEAPRVEVPAADSQPAPVSEENMLLDDDPIAEDAIETQLPTDSVPKSDATNEEATGSKESSPESSNGTVVSNDEGPHSEEDNETEEPRKPKGPRNAAWKAMLAKDAAMAKKKKKSSLVEEEAEEEEEEEVAGLEDFGFTVQKKKDEDDEPDALDQDDLEHVVDELSDGEGDEDAGKKARTEMQQKEEKERHKEMLRLMRDGYDGRRGGIAGGGAGARGVHRFDELVAADNRAEAEKLNLLNDDELDSENEMKDDAAPDEEEDETALLDKMLKDRFLHRSSVDENFSEDEEEIEETTDDSNKETSQEEEEEREQERLAKRFAKRARMQRLIEKHGHEEEFSQSRLIDEDTSLRIELQRMKDGLSRKSSQSTEMSAPKSTLSTNLFHQGGSLAIALQASRKANKQRTTFVRHGSNSSSEASSSYQKNIAFGHVVFHATDSKSQLSKSDSSNLASRSNKRPAGSLFSNSILSGFSKKRKL